MASGTRGHFRYSFKWIYALMNVVHGPKLSGSQNEERGIWEEDAYQCFTGKAFENKHLILTDCYCMGASFNGQGLTYSASKLENTSVPANEKHRYWIELGKEDKGPWCTSGAFCYAGFNQTQTLHKRSRFNCVFFNQPNPNLISLYLVLDRNSGGGAGRSFSIKCFFFFFNKFPFVLLFLIDFNSSNNL